MEDPPEHSNTFKPNHEPSPEELAAFQAFQQQQQQFHQQQINEMNAGQPNSQPNDQSNTFTTFNPQIPPPPPILPSSKLSLPEIQEKQKTVWTAISNTLQGI